MSRFLNTRVLVGSLMLLAMLAGSPRAALAQLNGFNIKGDMGLKSGSQAPPGGYIALFLYRYGADEILNRSGDRLLPNADGDITVGLGAGLINVVTTKKLLGANYGFAAGPLVFLNSCARIADVQPESVSGLRRHFHHAHQPRLARRRART